jgi:dihydroorotase
MKIRIAQATIVDKRHPDNGKKMDLLISNGIIEKIAEKIDVKVDKTVEAEGLCVSIGWMDMRANFRDPGDEHKENLESGLRAAAHGGFTAIALSPATKPAIDSKGAVEYVLNRSRETATEIIPIGAVSKGLKGESLSEMYDMYLAGAKAFGDDKQPLSESGMLHRALLYTKNFDATVMHFPFDTQLIPHGQMNEGVQSTKMGMRGIPAISEEMMVGRDLTLLEYTGGRLHLGPLSSPGSITLVNAARKKGLRITCETTSAHLAYNDDVLEGYDSNFKILPPLRAEKERKALIKALKNGLIDVISSDHSPEDEEHKKLEFEFASFGMASIESFFPLLYKTCKEDILLADLIATFSIHPRQILDVPVPEIQAGAEANLTLFSTEEKSHIVRNLLKTKGINIAELGQELEGKVVGIINRGMWVAANG